MQSELRKPLLSLITYRQLGLIFVLLIVVILLGNLTITAAQLPVEGDYFLDSTVGELAVWMADQSAEEEPESWLGSYAQSRVPEDSDSLDRAVLLGEFQTMLVAYVALLTGLAMAGGVLIFIHWQTSQIMLSITLSGVALLLFVFPPSSEYRIVTAILVCITILSLGMMVFSKHLYRAVGFLIILSLFTVLWEGSKNLANLLGYQVATELSAWEYEAYPTLEDALAAVDEGAVDVILADHSDLDELMAIYPLDDDEEATNPEDLPYPNLRYIRNIERSITQWGFPIEPELPGRVALVVRADQAEAFQSISYLENLSVGTIAESFAETDFLVEPRNLTLVDLHIANDLNLPHLQSIAEALLQPARRNGPLLLVRILANNALYTFTEALLGFVMGGLFGFLLGTIFAHVAFVRRSLLPYVVASQTIPIIALAPMIVIWLRDTHPLIPVAVIAAYLTFFPVTINTLRGLQSPDPRAFDLMTSYAASRWQIMWKLRFPSALPFIFTSLKVSATASVVGAIIGELPSGIRNGLGRAILDFSSDYSLISTPKLWGSIFMAALVGILFYLAVSGIEYLTIRGNNSQG